MFQGRSEGEIDWLECQSDTSRLSIDEPTISWHEKFMQWIQIVVFQHEQCSDGYGWTEIDKELVGRQFHVDLSLFTSPRMLQSRLLFTHGIFVPMTLFLYKMLLTIRSHWFHKFQHSRSTAFFRSSQNCVILNDESGQHCSSKHIKFQESDLVTS